MGPYNWRIRKGNQRPDRPRLCHVELALKDAGGKGWSQVFRVNSYHLPLNTKAMDAMVRNLRKYMPDHQPLWTCVGVTRLGEDDMRVEIEVSAHDPEGAKTA